MSLQAFFLKWAWVGKKIIIQKLKSWNLCSFFKEKNINNKSVYLPVRRKKIEERAGREKEECKQQRSKAGDGSRQKRGVSRSVVFPKRCHLAGAWPRMFCLQPMTESHKRGVEHMPLQLEHSMREENERERDRSSEGKICVLSDERYKKRVDEKGENRNWGEKLEESGGGCEFIWLRLTCNKMKSAANGITASMVTV